MKRATGYGFNAMKEIKSHSSVLYNERLAILFYLLDMKSIELNKKYQNRDLMNEVIALNRQIYKNIRTLIRNNPVMCTTLHLNTKEKSIYITDVMISTIERLHLYCEINGYTLKRCYFIVRELNDFEVQVKDILQYYHYFIRPDFRQKPDLFLATEKYQSMADGATIEQLREVVGKNNKIDFDNLQLISENDEQLNNEFNDEKNEFDDEDDEDDDEFEEED